MSDSDTKTQTDTAQGGRRQPEGTVAQRDNAAQNVVPANQAQTPAGLGQTSGITKEEVDAMGGSLKIHVKLNLELDVQVVAKLKGDIVVGIL